MNTKRKIDITRGALLGTALAVTACLTTPLWAAPFFFSTGNPNGLLGALSRRPSPGLIETETADDFAVQETAVIKDATIVGPIPSGTALDNIRDVEVEVYHEIDTATRARSTGTLAISATILNTTFFVPNTVINNLNVRAGGEGPFTVEEVESSVTFTSLIIESDRRRFRTLRPGTYRGKQNPGSEENWAIE